MAICKGQICRYKSHTCSLGVPGANMGISAGVNAYVDICDKYGDL